MSIRRRCECDISSYKLEELLDEVEGRFYRSPLWSSFTVICTTRTEWVQGSRKKIASASSIIYVRSISASHQR